MNEFKHKDTKRGTKNTKKPCELCEDLGVFVVNKNFKL